VSWMAASTASKVIKVHTRHVANFFLCQIVTKSLKPCAKFDGNLLAIFKVVVKKQPTYFFSGHSVLFLLSFSALTLGWVTGRASGLKISDAGSLAVMI